MDVKIQYINRFKQILHAESLRFTSQRRAVLENILASDDHRGCDDIFISLRNKGIPVSRATIYRTLEVLENAGFVRKMDIGDGCLRYEKKLPLEHHDHIICLKCGRIIEFVDPEIEHLQRQVARKYGFELIKHSHQLYGLCADCQETGTTAAGESSDA
ncbi:Fur family transcriptional regulator [Candidatus Neomarinimicrobiota bacterium]